jgi:DHA1 family inner membrane transport protein
MQKLALVALMLGNFATALAVLGPTGMLADLASGLNVSIAQAGLLITIGAATLCFASPLMAWWASTVDRRTLLAGVLLVVAAGHFASAAAPDYASLMILRVLTLIAAAVFTPQAAGTAAMIVSAENRPSAIAFIFLGWSLAVAGGLPLIGLVAGGAGWRIAYLSIGALSVAIAALVWFTVPGKLRGTPVSLSTWRMLARHRLVLLLLAVTAVQTSGQFTVITYLGPLLADAGATAGVIGLFFALFGVSGFVGNVAATQIVRSIGATNTALGFLLAMSLGMAIWTFGNGWLAAMAVGVIFWGLGFAAFNSMQQARLIFAAPEASAATIALNTSCIYVGQAVGSALGGVLFALGAPAATGPAATLVSFTSLAIFWLGARAEPRMESGRS